MILLKSQQNSWRLFKKDVTKYKGQEPSYPLHITNALQFSESNDSKNKYATKQVIISLKTPNVKGHLFPKKSAN